jgi:hypothetical protein
MTPRRSVSGQRSVGRRRSMSGHVSRHVSQPATPNAPRPVRVRVEDGEPIEVDGERVENRLEDWLVEGWWWTDHPVRRRYWELVTVTGRNRVVFHDLLSGGWYAQAA